MSESMIVGVDIAKAKFDAAILGGPGQAARAQTFANHSEGFAALRAWWAASRAKSSRRRRKHARAHESLRGPVACLESIPGVGEVTALTLAAELPRGRSARSVANWAGLIPRHFESGQSMRTRLSKQGSDCVRRILCWPAITALRCNPAMKPFQERLQESGHRKMEIIGVAMHKLLRWAVGVLNAGVKFAPSLHAHA